MVLQTIPWEDKCDFHQRPGGFWRASGKYPGCSGASKSCRRNNFSYEQLNVQRSNFKYWQSNVDEDNVKMFDFIDTSLGYWREGVGNDTETVASETTKVNFELPQILMNRKYLISASDHEIALNY
jgi:hypothetical protein